MHIALKKLKNGFAMPEFGLGTWHMGGSYQPDPSHDERDIEAIRAAIRLGVTHIDTAELYGQGHAEELVGQAIREFERSDLFIISKVWPTHMSYGGMFQACKASLERLGTDYLDVYVLHRYSPAPAETMRAMDDMVDEGLIRAIGVSNYGVEHLIEAQKLARHPVVYNQVHYNLEFREPERSGLLDYCQQADVLLAAWRPVQRGALLEDPPEVMRKVCDKYGKTPAQVALNWLLSQKNVVTLSKTSTVEHLEENLGAIGWTMEPEDVELLRREYPGQKDVSNTVPLE